MSAGVPDRVPKGYPRENRQQELAQLTDLSPSHALKYLLALTAVAVEFAGGDFRSCLLIVVP